MEHTPKPRHSNAINSNSLSKLTLNRAKVHRVLYDLKVAWRVLLLPAGRRCMAAHFGCQRKADQGSLRTCCLLPYAVACRLAKARQLNPHDAHVA